MSETPGQALERVFLRVTADKTIPVDDCFEEIAAAFLAECPLAFLIDAAEDRGLEVIDPETTVCATKDSVRRGMA